MTEILKLRYAIRRDAVSVDAAAAIFVIRIASTNHLLYDFLSARRRDFCEIDYSAFHGAADYAATAFRNGKRAAEARNVAGLELLKLHFTGRRCFIDMISQREKPAAAAEAGRIINKRYTSISRHLTKHHWAHFAGHWKRAFREAHFDIGELKHYAFIAQAAKMTPQR